MIVLTIFYEQKILLTFKNQQENNALQSSWISSEASFNDNYTEVKVHNLFGKDQLV